MLALIAGSLSDVGRIREGGEALERHEYDIVRARKFEMVDEQDRVRVAIGPGSGSSTGIQLYDEEGNSRAELSVWEDGSTIFQMTEDGGDTVSLAVGDGTPTVSVSNTSGSEENSWAIALAGEDPNQPYLQQCSLIASKGGKPQLVLTLMGAGETPCLLMRQGDGLVRMVP